MRNPITCIDQIPHLSFGISAAYPLRGETVRDKVATEDLNVKLSALRRLSGCSDVSRTPSPDNNKGALKKSIFFMQVLQGGSKLLEALAQPLHHPKSCYIRINLQVNNPGHSFKMLQEKEELMLLLFPQE